MFKNPVLPGFNPDPSICRVGDEYYLVTSTFAYFPGLPIYKSRDLVSWEQIGNVLDRPEQLDLDGAKSTDGLYAPSIRYNNGTFYVICTNMTRGGNFVVTATDPKGPWSNPHFLKTDGIDPSLFFDDDGHAYYVGQRRTKENRYSGDCEIYIQEFDTEELQVKGEPTVVWDGALKNAVWAEGPRLYKMFGYYYLMIAEGGTRCYHSETMARSRSLLGPYMPCMRNPILTHRHLGNDYPITSVGHADLVETQNGEWWIFALGCRNIGKGGINLGRETFLAKIDWDKDNWPLVNKGVGVIRELSPISPNLEPSPVANLPELDKFEYDKLPFYWLTARTPRDEFYKLTNPGLRLYAKKTYAADTQHFSFLARRMQHKNFTVKTAFMLQNISANEKAGLVLMQKNTHYFEIAAGNGEISLTMVDNRNPTTVKRECKDGKIYLTVEVREHSYNFYYGYEENEKIVLAEDVDGAVLGTEYAVGYTGLVLGMFASSYGEESKAYADFEYFYYSGNDKTDKN